MDFRQLITYVQVINLKSFSKASEKLYMTQPTVTNQIQKLEEELGVTLLNRNCREITPTEPGISFYSYAAEMINLKEAAIYQLNSYKGKIEGIVEICTSSIPAQYILPCIIKDFKALYPHVCFKIQQTDSKNVCEKIKEGYSNFGVAGFDFKCKNIECTKLMGDNLVLALPKSYEDRFSHYDNISLEELLTIPIILREEGSGSRYMVEEELLKQGISIDQLNISAAVNNNNTIKRLINLNFGGSFMSYLAVKGDISRGEIIPVNIAGMDLKRNFYFVCHKKRFLSPLSNAFKEFVLKSAENMDIPSEL
jgi:Transcriptional regulator